MTNLEFLNTPFYINTANMVTSLATITFDTLYENTLSLVNIIRVGIETFVFITQQGIVAAFANLTLEKIVYIIGVYNLLMLIVLDEQRKKIAEQKELIKTLEKNVNYLKKTERMRENFNELWIQEIKLYHQETSNKIVLIDKKMKKLEKNLKQYE
jgi:hypothetical protein